jgi:hypothetical protein
VIIEAVSEVIGTLLLVGVVVVGIALVGVLLLSNPTPSKVPVLDSIVTNLSKTIYISHKGGDPLWKGQYRILVDGVDRTGLFVSDGAEPWSVGKTLNYTSPTMPKQVVLVSNQSQGGSIVLFSTDLTKMVLLLPAFVQVAANSATTATFPGPSNPGDLIVVSSYWSSQAVSVTSVTDTKGNTYNLAIGPTNWGGASYRGATYYASNIAGGGAATTITITYSGAQGGTITFAAEYSGVATFNPLDQVSAQTGTGTVLNSGTVATGQGTELIYGFGMSAGVATIDPPYTARSVLSNNFIADRTVFRTGYYSVTGTNANVAWLCQMATFRGG